MKLYYSCIVFLVSFASLSAQATLRGSVRDADNGQALIGASIQLTTAGQGNVTDSLGNFRFDNLAPGRYPLSISYLGYQQLTLQEVLVSSGKEQILDILLQEAATSLTAVTVKASRAPQGTANVVRLTQEETLRFPATFNDPARLALAYPGAIGADDQANHLIVRGQSPLGMQWRLEGLEIVNPNHTPNAGTFSDRSTVSGGGIIALSSQLLEEANFYLGDFPAQYGNASAGLMDMRLRRGNNEKREYTLQAGLIGIDLAAEGPIQKGKSSYLVNYRYSFTGLLSDLGVDLGDEDIRFQDISYQLSFPAASGRQLKFFGLSGSSSNGFTQPEDSAEWETEKDLYQSIDFNSNMHAHGFSWIKPQQKKGLWRIAGMASWLNSERLAIPSDTVDVENDGLEDRKMSVQLSYRRKLLPFGSIKLGVEGLYLDQSIAENNALIMEPVDRRTNTGWIVSPFLDWQYQIKKVDLGVGYRTSLWLNWPEWQGKTAYTEPRLSIGYSPSKKSGLRLGYSVSSQAPSTYALAVGPRRVKQWSLSGSQILGKTRKLSLQVYQQQLSQFAGTGALSEINQLNLFIPDTDATSEGRTRGIEASLQQFATGGWWYVLSASVFDARYLNEQNEWVKTRFSQDYASSLTLGKEWSGLDKEKRTNRVGFNIALRLNGGLRSAPILLQNSRDARTTVFDYTKGFTEQLPAYFRGDLRIYYQKNNANWSSMLSLDIQNFSGQQNTAYEYYDRFLDQINTRYQLEFIPLLSYRINF